MDNTQVKYQRLKFKIHGKKDEDIADMLRPFEARYAACRKLQKSSQYLAIMKYLLYLYDPGTDLNQDFYRLEDRKQEAAKLSGLNKITDIPTINAIFDCTHADALEVIQVLLSEVFHDRKYREWQTLHNELDEYTSARWEKTESSRKRRKKGDEGVEYQESSGSDKAKLEAMNMKSKLREECKKIHENLDILEKDIFGDNKDVQEIAYKSRFTSPESYSRAAKSAF